MNYSYKQIYCPYFFGNTNLHFFAELCPHINLFFGQNLTGKSTLFSHLNTFLTKSTKFTTDIEVLDSDEDILDDKFQFDETTSDFLLLYNNDNTEIPGSIIWNSASIYIFEHVFPSLRVETNGVKNSRGLLLKYIDCPIYMLNFIKIICAICNTKKDCILFWDDIGKSFSVQSQSLLLRVIYEVKQNLQLIATTNSIVIQNIPKTGKIKSSIQNFENLFFNTPLNSYNKMQKGEHNSDK